MKNSADLGGCYPLPPSASVDNTLLDLQNSSYPTQPHPIIAKYFRKSVMHFFMATASILVVVSLLKKLSPCEKSTRKIKGHKAEAKKCFTQIVILSAEIFKN